MIKLQNLCFPDGEICPERDLYFHEEGNSLRLDGFFNLLYLEKRKKYTRAERLVLKLSAPGYSRLDIYCDKKKAAEFPLDPEDCGEKSFELPYTALKGRVLYPVLEKAGIGDPCLPRGAIYADLPEEDLRPVNIGIDICTYRREAYVSRNLEKLRQRLLENPAEEAGQHLRIYVIDNGRTLDTHTGDQRIRILPNKNTGGAGGFTRGMLEILDDREQYGLTHVLLMDDDAVLDPETVVRLYGFLSTTKEAWKNVTVGGVLLDENQPKRLLAFGEWWKNARLQHTLGGQDLSTFESASAEHLTEAEHEYERYSGWWCCCFSLNVANEKNLPLPVFIHHDDIEYGQRNRRQGCVFLNGIGVWHNGFDRVFNGVNSYYNTRNGLINFVCQDSGDARTALFFALRNIGGAVLRFQYNDAKLCYQGVLDFLKGPDWLYRQAPEQLNSRLRKHVMPLHPWEDLKEELTAQEFRRLTAELEQFRREDAQGADVYGKRRYPRRWKHLLTLNGLLLKGDLEASLFFPMDSIYRNYRKEKVVLCEPNSGKAALVRRNYKELLHAAALLLRTVIGMRKQYSAAAEQWKTGYRKLITREAWEQYLNRK